MIYLVKYEVEIHGYTDSLEAAETYIKELAIELNIPEHDIEQFEIIAVDKLAI
jgi:hypothetical protein